MIRFVDLSGCFWAGPPDPGEPHWPFAFIDTITARFVEFNETQIWDCVEEFKQDWNEDTTNPKMDRLCLGNRPWTLERFLNLIPADVPIDRAGCEWSYPEPVIPYNHWPIHLTVGQCESELRQMNDQGNWVSLDPPVPVKAGDKCEVDEAGNVSVNGERRSRLTYYGRPAVAITAQ